MEIYQFRQERGTIGSHTWAFLPCQVQGLQPLVWASTSCSFSTLLPSSCTHPSTQLLSLCWPFSPVLATMSQGSGPHRAPGSRTRSLIASLKNEITFSRDITWLDLFGPRPLHTPQWGRIWLPKKHWESLLDSKNSSYHSPSQVCWICSAWI